MTTTRRFARTTAEAFKDADYAGAVYRYRPRRSCRIVMMVGLVLLAAFALMWLV